MLKFLVKLFVRQGLSPVAERESVGKLAGFFGIVCNALLCAIKLAVGVISGSISVIADALNNMTDALSSVITVVCFKLSGKPADKDHPYGHERIEYVATLLLAFLIVFIGYELLKTSADRIINPKFSPLSPLTAIVLIVSIAGKLFMSVTYRGFADMIDSPVLRAAGQDSLNDVISTAAILAAAVAGTLLNVSLDGYAGALMSLFIIWSGITLVREALNPILGSAPDKEFVNKIACRVMSYDGVIGIHDLIVHSYGPNKTFASVHAEVDANGDVLASHDIIDNIEREVSQEMGIELVIHMDPIVTDDEMVSDARGKVEEIVEEIDPVLSIHDFRMVPGNTHTNLIFDVVLPFEFRYSDDAVAQKIQTRVFEMLGREYFCVINFDRDYLG
ncbi:MAG: cation transporter [Clostridia bacterium]|nr:cation transporter [Clostridia bacterium]